tara:strand:+ start:6847 stop:7620 length:774 start_codon:yes stop_codon:yes gene_type:complete
MVNFNNEELLSFLNFKSQQYESLAFIETDPILIPHQFNDQKDIEIMAFLMATIAWGNRNSIIKSGERLIDFFDNAPYDFIMNAKDTEINKLNSFVHRTFNGQDLICFVQNLKALYEEQNSLEFYFLSEKKEKHLQFSISRFKSIFFSKVPLQRTFKHIADPLNKSAAKRINLFLRWMVRPNDKSVDFGIWKQIDKSLLSIPLDVHSGRVARKLKLLNRKQNDHLAVMELDKALRKLDPKDPVKFDFALFGLGVFEQF